MAQTALGAWLALTLLTASARRDASALQLMRLNNEIVDLIRNADIPARQLGERVLEIMGPTWTPDDETRAFLIRLAQE